MIQIVYTSAARERFSPSALDALLSKARIRNALYQVTGMLLYHSGSFLQVLEGPPEGVGLIFDAIGRDSRHTDTKVLNKQVIAQREFTDWSMGFLDVSPWGFDTPGKVDYRLALRNLPTGSAAAAGYIRRFHMGLHRQALLA